jgi:heme A synthase
MTDPLEPRRPVPRWLHAWAVLTVVATLALLVLGQLVTSFRAGMADPIWPTEPWYLFAVGWQEPNRGYLIEHSHRIAGWTVGFVVAVLALGLWVTEPVRALRRVGLVCLLVLLAAYGQLHRDLIAQRDPAVPVHVPPAPLAVMGATLLAVLGIAASRPGVRGSGLRARGVVALVAVMVQGLLGGFRVRLDALLGPELAPVHGVFAQVVFCLLVALAVLTGRPVTTDLPESSRRTLGRLSLALVGLLFVQLVWGAMVRHTPTPLNQRLHLLTAFLAVAAAVWLLRVGFTTPAARPRIALTGWLLGVLIALQVTLGVEAWMGKFGDEARQGKAAAGFLPEAEKVGVKQAAIRTAHTLVGTGVLAAAVVLAIRVRQRAAGGSGIDQVEVTADRFATGRAATLEVVGSQPGDTP